jgi:Uma2 family endonuclease
MQVTTEQIIYPSSDGQPMAESTIQYKLIVTIKEGCESLFKNDPNVFVAADLLWYPVQGRPDISQAPDTMVIFGRPKGDRPSYLQFQEDNIAPQVVFEIRSHNDRQAKMYKKLAFYNRYGVEEYYVYDPENKDLSGWQRIEGNLEIIDPIEGWISPRLEIGFEVGEDGLEICQPDEEAFVSPEKLREERDFERQRAEKAIQKAERLAAKLRELNVDPDRI